MRFAAHFRRTLPLALTLLSMSACAGDTTPAVVHDSREAGATASTPPDSAAVASAERVLRTFLDASRETTPDPVALDSLGACGDDGQSYFPSTLLAGFTLLPFEARGDTIVGRAEVVTVAEIDVDRRAGNRFIARERVRSDVLEWDVIALDAGKWVVCNGLRFGARGVDSLTTWRPDGASYEHAKLVADSIAAVRR